ncbi:isoprenylcysteine carboxylmethyltransferase family protein [Pseudenhygromyxa sp. WMMC2535]|uniref:methyltransferase family protein n=1 Tax=Pseudenhygromyxa sp. WMMC2535 TaxID=2712867 RepID=UPI001555BE4C|nr:isoprenylcysteine carboxylmethyltransferase family protein [Pseudenhygromyxa sp. WMMC2535]NVB38502.1 isoprenylcysteine carboxylmethyltransferase family protein [Pseudenhygromyxa sp. WMMC2535]
MSADVEESADERRDIAKKTLVRLVAGFLSIAAILFIPAGTLRYWAGWLYMAVFLGPASAAGIYFLRHDRALLARRLRTKESQSDQRWIIALTNTLFIAGFILPGLDFRFGWSQLPWPVILAANALVAAGYALVFWVLRTNSYASRTIEVDAGQRVIDTGPYAWIRHPMYTGVLVMMLASPLALGSLWALLPFALLLPPLLVWRIRGEERVLGEQLVGYASYCARVRWRLIPGIW